MFFPFLETATRYYFNFKPDREVFELSDGGAIALDFFYCQNSDGKKSDKETSKNPLLVIVPGLTGDCTVLYSVSTVKAALQNGYDAVLVNYRGMAGVPLKV
jgi:predicted alpha/beta-fold hydrolase